ncbi:hypothetical protein, variant 1 [Exophiala sideris]|uniref:Zn(2)-C6 fungal-type domain-containing protein n=2 Tax=Exophiala sideris TaxID=1016849 RepID=A0A0D1YCY9_9EURO|nr:hypothetical protein, variant 1 [Exophiala sideris]
MDAISRSRQGCWTCRARRIKCDERRPVCQRCQRKKLDCGYEVRLVWQDDNIARGVSHGRAGVWSKHGTQDRAIPPVQKQTALPKKQKQAAFSPIDSPIYLNTTCRDVQLYLGHHDNSSLCNEDVYQSRPLSGRPDKRQVQEDEIAQDDESAVDEAGHNEVEPFLSQVPAGALGRTLSLMPLATSPFDSVLISYFENVICSSSTLLDDKRYNPYRHVLLPMAFQSAGIYHATLAISANTLRLARPEYRVFALEHKQQALKALISIVKRRPSSNSDMDEMMGLILMLCWFEINDGCRPSWVKHLSGFRSLIRHHDENSSSRSACGQSLEKFFLQYFAFHLVLAKTAFRVDDVDLASGCGSDSLEAPVPPSSPLSASSLPSSILTASSTTSDHDKGFSFSPSTSFLSCHMPLETLDEIDPYMGFSNALLLLINEIADLAESQGPHLNSPQGLLDQDRADRVQTRSLRLKAGLEELEQRLPSAASSGQELAMRTPAVLATAEAYRLGALLLLYEVTTIQGTTRPWVNCVISRMDRTRHIQSILKLVEDNFDAMVHTAALPLWPLFLAGCCVDSDQDRLSVLRLFERTEQRKRYGNIPPARRVMEMVWRQRDLSMEERCVVSGGSAHNPKHMGLQPTGSVATAERCKPASNRSRARNRNLHKPRYEWERASAMLGGWKISLT